MQSINRRVYVEKKKEYAAEANNLLFEIKESLQVKGLEEVRIINRYDIEALNDDEYAKASRLVFSETNVDNVYHEEISFDADEKFFAVEYLPGQYDQRADSAAQCIQILTQKERPIVRTAKVIVLKGVISDEELDRVKSYSINRLDSREASMEKPCKLDTELVEVNEIKILKDFISYNSEQLEAMIKHLGLAMSLEDLEFCQQYFRDIEKRDPSFTELRVIDTYWSDHCRHTTFLTQIQNVTIQDSIYNEHVKKAYDLYQKTRKFVYNDEKRDISLMDIATIGMKEMRKQGLLEDLEISDEINACSIVVEVELNGETEEWLLMFKNETHNHPTEIEPFGGAATCLGGAIRDPLSGRSYVFGAMRVTGSGDPRTPIEQTIPGKLPQRKITTGAASGYSSYGNQIGLATGQVAEIYHPNYVAKRMEIGAVLGAAPRSNVIRDASKAGDVIVLLGGRTGRDGCGGATGSSKEHDDNSIISCGAEVQKGNPPTERKLQRLFRNPKASRLIKKSNDFGAGGVAVAIGELADGLVIDLDAVPKKYEGLDGTELAISESQERMAVLLDREDLNIFISYAKDENLEAVKVAEVTGEKRLVMLWKGSIIVDISRDFLNTNGVKQHADAIVMAPSSESYFEQVKKEKNSLASFKDRWIENLRDLNVCSQKGLVERFDSSIGGGTVLMPFGGEYQSTPVDGLVMKLPVQGADTNTAAVMTYGFNPYLSSWSPFHGAMYAVVEAAAKAAVLGADYSRLRLTLQEYFEKLGKNPEKWGKPLSALLGAYYAQAMLGIPAIGGKDSMSGTFKELNVPPTVVAFAVGTMDADKAVSPEFKCTDSHVVMLCAARDQHEMPDFEQLKNNLDRVRTLIGQGRILSASVVKHGGAAAALSKMCFGNKIGMQIDEGFKPDNLFTADYGNIILEIGNEFDIENLFKGLNFKILGRTQQKQEISWRGEAAALTETAQAWKKPLSKVFPSSLVEIKDQEYTEANFYYSNVNKRSAFKIAAPRILIPVFPGTNCEYDTARAFEEAGGRVQT
ncbi:MAG: phosphoribosylformylglycinamidine synthase, partial [Clostridia bacterium]|nr:phosphoribosylformylglycinamidine synthase [Clostridia bacterium]